MRWLISKDLRILKRSPLLVALLIIYPVMISVLIGMALSRGPEKPKVAIYTPLQSNSDKDDFRLGSAKVDTKSFRKEFFDSIDGFDVNSRAAALQAVRDGDALAALIVPDDIKQKLSSGLEQPEVEVAYNVKDPVKAQFLEDILQSKLSDANHALSDKFTKIAAQYIDLIVSGGHINILGQEADILGLKSSVGVLQEVQKALPQGSSDSRDLQRVISFANLAVENLDLSDNLLTFIGEPIKIKRTDLSGERTPLNLFAVAIATAISLMFIAVLLAAGMLALEREEHTFNRLIRGLVSPTKLIISKILLAAGCALVVSLLLLFGVNTLVDLDLGRVLYWLAALSGSALAAAALGVTIGVLAREVRAASLLSFVLVLPLAFLALVPSGSVSGAVFHLITAVSFIFPFKASLDAISSALAASSSSLMLALLHLAVTTVALFVISRLSLRRFS